MAVVLQNAPALGNDGMGSLFYGNDECRFRVWAPFADAVEVVLTCPGGDIPITLEREPNGNWSGVVKGVQPLQKYRYSIETSKGDWNDDSQKWEQVDARALQVESSGSTAASFIIDSGQFTDGARPNDYRTPSFENFLIYQLHVGTFNGRNSRPGMLTGPRDSAKFWELEEKLGYIKSLNFDAIALLPIGENPGDVSEGYAPSHQFAPESAYASSPPYAVLNSVASSMRLTVVAWRCSSTSSTTTLPSMIIGTGGTTVTAMG